MATLAQIKRFVEGTDLIGEVQQDVKNIQNTDLSTRRQGWNDLGYAIEKEVEYADLFSDSYSVSKGIVEKVQGDAETYLKGITETVADPHGGADVSLMHGSSGTTVWDSVIDTQTQFSVTYTMESGWGGPWPWDAGDSWTQQFCADWGSVPNTVISDPSWESSFGTEGGDTKTICSSGTADQWASFVHLNGGDASAMNADALFGG